MVVRVRQKGDRRRSTGLTLVRSRPYSKHLEPPIPLPGRIYRAIYGSAISDYASLSTASWSTGTTGGATDYNANCLYHHYTTTSRNSIPVEYILQPIRWQMAMPTVNGGVYDRWAQSRDFGNAGTTVPTLTAGQYQHAIDFDLNARAIAPVHTMLVAGSHVDFEGGFATHSVIPYPIKCPSSSLEGTWPTNLNAISALPVWFGTNYVQVYAARHWVNGVATSAVNTDCQNPNSPFWSFTVSKGDTYYLDVWYRIGSTVNGQSGGGKQCVFLPTTLVFNGSRMIRTTTLTTPTWLPDFTFANANFTPAFNYTSQTYQVTIAGHTGWTLKGGSNGPHKMQTLDGWSATIAADSITWVAPGDHAYVSRIQLVWSSEIAYLYLYPRSGMSVASQQLIYKPTSDGTYRTSTQKTGSTTLTHAPMGRFSQAGTTTFDLVQWSQLAQARANMDAYIGGAVSPGMFVPTTITVTRTSR